MRAYVALLRGINVGGRNILPMQRLRDLLSGCGCEQAATYIQSGNAVFRHAGSELQVAGAIGDSIEREFGFRPGIVVLAASQFAAIIAANPFADDDIDPKSMHVWFMQETVPADRGTAMAKLAAATERFHLTKTAFYLYAPDGIGRSKLAARVEQLLGVAATGRNLRTVQKIEAMLRALD